MRTVLVTGAGGFLGRAIVRKFATDGWRVIGVDHASIPREVPCFRSLTMRLPSTELNATILSNLPELVIHAAGPSSVPASIADPAADFTNSVPVLLNVLEAVRTHAPTSRVLFLSSAAVYGNPATLPVVESSATEPISPYGNHKLMCESLLREFCSLYGLNTCAVRIFSAYGEGLRRQVFWDICRQALVSPVVRLMGTGAESRDFIHAKDVALGISVVVDRGIFDARSYNLATGEETRIDQLAALLIGAIGKSNPVEFSGEVRPGDPIRWRADIGQLTALGYVPGVPIKEGVEAYARWVGSHGA
ncbi:MAG TPA: SDR family oxidoreductase [Nitrospiria bacterium]|nr:SDR family oxidoreductase [Nitrospiria bacterium]